MTAPNLRPRSDGLLDADALPAFPLMAPRLQGELSPDGELKLSLWCVGEVGRLRLAGLGGPMTIAPNRIETRAGPGFYIAQSQPVLALKGGCRPQRQWALDAGKMIVEARGEDWLVACGQDETEARAALALSVEQVIDEASAYVGRCDRLPAADPLLRSMVVQSAHAGLSAARRTAAGEFAGLAAGLIYSAPPRTYYRDGYWTMQLLLRLAPDVAAAEIERLATHVQADGEAPSAVIIEGPHAEAFERRRLESLEMAAAHWRPGEWWSDHFDSPLFFVLAVGDCAAATGDLSLAEKHWGKLVAVFERYRRLAGPDGLPRKPRNDRDWADNVVREGLVAYDLGLWVGALAAIARLGERLDAQLAAQARADLALAREGIDAWLWRDGGYADYVRPDAWAETHLALDTLTLLRYGAVAEDHAAALLARMRERLESRRNHDQPFGDFGMLSVFPLFADRSALRAKSAFPFRYHNGGDWPWLDALYAAERLKRGLGGWRYPLTRWWSWSLEQGWAGAVEHFSPAYGRGSLLQAWSSLPAAVALEHANAVMEDDPDEAEAL